MTISAETSPIPRPEDLVDTYRRFGTFGPVYQILEVCRYLNNGDAMLLVEVVETGEKVEILYSHVVQDPAES